MTVVFFHQNEVMGVQGGVERFLATLMSQGKEVCHLVTEELALDQGKNRLCLSMVKIPGLPKWVRFTLTIWANKKKIRAYLKEVDATVLEFSRPQYALFAFLFPGKKVFTYHGTGPINTELLLKAITYLFSWFVLFQADSVQIVGPDTRALPKFVERKLGNKISIVDAWYDDCFTPAPFPEKKEPLRLFYAGRIAPQKNPELLFSLARALYEKYGNDVVFNYYGADGNLIPSDLLGKGMIDCGLQTPQQLAEEIRSCHFGILTSFYEGSPFIVVEGLACGRGYVIAPIRGLLRTYPDQPGVVFTEDYTVGSFLEKIKNLKQQIDNGDLSADDIVEKVSWRSKTSIAQNIINKLLHIGETTKSEKA